MAKNTSLRLLQIGNVLAFILTIAVNTLANTLPIGGMNTGQLSDLYPNLFVPVGFTFSIWSVIYIGLGLFVLYQLGIFSKGKDEHLRVVTSIGWLFVISSIGNISWIFLWHYQLVALSLIAMFVILFSLIMIYLRLRERDNPSTKQRWFVRSTFSIYLGWISVATIANVTAVLVDINWTGWGLTPQIWTVIVLTVATVLAAIFLLQRRDILYSLVIVWAFGGILTKHLTFFNSEYISIIVACILYIILITVGMVFTYFKNRRLAITSYN